MEEISKRLKVWFDLHTDTEKCQLIKDKAVIVNNNRKKMEKAVDSEFNFNGDRRGVRGGKSTTLTAKAQTATEFYLDSLGELKYMVASL